MSRLTVGEVKTMAMQIAAEAISDDESDCVADMEATLYRDVLEEIAKNGNELAKAAIQTQLVKFYRGYI